MSGKKCAECGLVNWPQATICGRCGSRLTDAAAAGTSAEQAEQKGQDVGRRPTPVKWQVLRSLLWAVVVCVAWGALLMVLAGLYDWATGAPPRQTGAPHNFPKNPFILLAIFTISPCFVPFVYALIAVLLFIFFGRREAAKS